MTEKKTQRFESEMPGLPPLKMVLVHHQQNREAGNEEAQLNEESEVQAGPINKEVAVRKLIEHLNKKS